MKYVFITPVDDVVVFFMVIFFVIHVSFFRMPKCAGQSAGDFEPELPPKTDRSDACGNGER
jgi:hypothetical protein